MKDLTDIALQIEKIYKYLVQRYDEKDGTILTERITNLNVALARSAELLADAEYYLNKKKGLESGKIYENERLSKLKPTEIKFLLDGKTADEQRVYKQCERLNRAITHQLEGLRTQLSYLKSLPNY